MGYVRTKITRNAARCKKYNTVVESRSVHDLRTCKCKAMFVDGGLEYLRRGGDLDAIEELSHGFVNFGGGDEAKA